MQKFILSCLSLIMVAACTTTPANDLLECDGNESVNLQNGAETTETLPPGKARVRFVFEGLTFNTSPMTKTAPPRFDSGWRPRFDSGWRPCRTDGCGSELPLYI